MWTAGVADTWRGENNSYARDANRMNQTYLNKGYKQGRTDYNKGYTEGQGYMNQGIDTLTGMRTDQLNALNTQYGAGRDALNQGFGAAAEQWQPFHDQSMAGYEMFQNSLGLGGAEGTAAAQDAFKTGPGYQWNVDQVTDQAARQGNRYGMLQSGNTTGQMARLASNLANQEYGNWQKNLSGFQGAAQNSTAALADIYAKQGAGLAGLETDLGNRQSDVYGQAGKGISGIQTAQGGMAFQRGQDLASMDIAKGTSLANSSANMYGQLMNNNNQYYQTLLPAGQQAMQAGQQAAQNKMATGIAVGQMVASAFGGGFGSAAAGGGGQSGGGGSSSGFGSFLSGLFGK
jgi:hypothetical protein